ncbi:hypothetical protein C9975_05855 [Thalassospira xiamenensis]|nr:hypothetical protein C9975_05855 [Thalassospira xiamenensis]
MTIVGAWGRIRLVSGDVLCTLITQHEIENVESHQISMANFHAQDTPWTDWKDKCVRNMVLRRLFSERAKELKLIDSSIALKEVKESVEATLIEDDATPVSDDDFERLLLASEASIEELQEQGDSEEPVTA